MNGSWLPTPKVQAVGATLLSACIATLSSGTNYAYSAYAPQLSSRLSLSSTRTNLIGAAGNLGVYFSGPSVGSWVDKSGPRSPLIFAALAVCAGYALIRHVYEGGPESEWFQSYGLAALIFGELLTGVGSSASLTASTNGVAKSFQPSRRGSALALVVSCFGLSAFFYSTLSHASFIQRGDPTSTFLLALAIGCFFTIGQGAAFIRPVSQATLNGYETIVDEEESSERRREHDDTLDAEVAAALGLDESGDEAATRVNMKAVDPVQKNQDFKGWLLLQQLDFWLLFCIIGCCSGTGLMWINNVGTIVKTLSHAERSPKDIVTKQASLVSLLSIFNCGGRLLSGFVSDYFLHHAPPNFRVARPWFFVPVAGLFFFTQILALHTTEVEGFFGLALPTALTGLAYGALFGLMPVCTLEFWGMANFSMNNGYISLSPAVFGNTANLFFGHVYDRQVARETPSPLQPSLGDLGARSGGGIPESHLCLLGSECFSTAFHGTALLTLVAVGLACWLGVRRNHNR